MPRISSDLLQCRLLLPQCLPRFSQQIIVPMVMATLGRAGFFTSNRNAIRLRSVGPTSIISPRRKHHEHLRQNQRRDLRFGPCRADIPVRHGTDTCPSSIPEPAATTAPPVGGTGQAVPSTSGSSAPVPSAPTSASTQQVDVASQLDAAVKRSGHRLDWKHSIVDLMKALGMDASLAERKELAQELGYTGELNGSAEMNNWLHKALLKKLSENGGKVPAELLD